MSWLKQRLRALFVPSPASISDVSENIDSRPRWRIALSARLAIVSLLFIVLTAAVITLLRPPSESHLTSVTSSSPTSSAGGSLPPSVSVAMHGDDSDLLVYVVGSVQRPGLFAIPVGSRVLDALMAAGGFTTNSELCAINLARTVTDGEQITVPFTPAGAQPCSANNSQVAGATGGGAQAPVSLSRASLAELDALPGIGPALAQRIIDFREQHGSFTDVQQLDDVSGIGVKLLANLTPLVVP